jgi:hypothetical protein
MSIADNNCRPKRYSPKFIPDIDYVEDDGENSIKVGVVIDNKHLTAYVEADTKQWYVNYNDISVGFISTGVDVISYWYYLPGPNFVKTKIDEGFVRICGCEDAKNLNEIIPENKLIERANQLYDKHSEDGGYDNFLKFIWVEFPNGKEAQLLELVPIN